MSESEQEDKYPSITCPVCDKTSYHPMDIAYGYCGFCNAYTGVSQR